jgi:hypothetical protein
MTDRVQSVWLGPSSLAGSAVIGLTVYLLVGSVAGWIAPIWWGGEELMVPLWFGIGLILVGAAPFYLLARLILRKLEGAESVGAIASTGFIFGILQMPLIYPVSAILRPLLYWEVLDRHRQAVGLLGLAAAGFAGVGIGAAVTALFSRHKSV